MDDQIALDEVTGCTCLRARRAARQLSRLYDGALEPAGITANQLGLLAKLLAARRRGLTGLSLGELAERVGMHYSTLNRDLKPLKREGFVRDARDEGDRRIRTVSITNKGRAKLAEAIPAWRRAQAHVQDTLGIEVMLSLNALLDLACAKVTK